jgi:hypothetical protein
MYISTDNKAYGGTEVLQPEQLQAWLGLASNTTAAEPQQPQQPDVVAVSSSEKHLRALQDDLRKAGYRRAAFK